MRRVQAPEPGGGREGDIGLADVAVAVLGPVALLWIVFQTLAAVNSEQQRCNLDDAELEARSERLKTWYAGQRLEFARLDDARRKSCGSGTQLPTFAPSDSQIVPDILHGVCGGQQLQILRKGELSGDSLARLAAERAGLAIAVAACAGTSACIKLTTSHERRRLADDLKAWYRARGKKLGELKAALARDCPGIAPAAHARSGPSIPPALADLCAPDRAAVVSEAGLGLGAIGQLEQQIDAALSAYSSCRPPGNETATDIERSIQFFQCTTEFTFKDQPRPKNDQEKAELERLVEAEFRKIAGNVLAKIHAYNRLEVRGHTDETPIVGNCEGATNNAQLSSLRAHRFNERLLRTIERLASTDRDAVLMLARLPWFPRALERRRQDLERELERRNRDLAREIERQRKQSVPQPLGFFGTTKPAPSPRLSRAQLEARRDSTQRRLDQAKALAERIKQEDLIGRTSRATIRKHAGILADALARRPEARVRDIFLLLMDRDEQFFRDLGPGTATPRFCAQSGRPEAWEVIADDYVFRNYRLAELLADARIDREAMNVKALYGSLPAEDELSLLGIELWRATLLAQLK